jgi:hypothetical protein
MEKNLVFADMRCVPRCGNPTGERLGVYYKEYVQMGIRYRKTSIEGGLS